MCTFLDLGKPSSTTGDEVDEMSVRPDNLNFPLSDSAGPVSVRLSIFLPFKVAKKREHRRADLIFIASLTFTGTR